MATPDIDINESSPFDQLLKPYVLSLDTVKEIVNRIENAFNRGLSSDNDTFLYSPVKMLPTHLCVIPDGSEVGRFFAIDLGGTNLRFLEISVVDGRLKPTSISYEVPAKYQTGTGEALFDFIAGCVEEGLEKVGLKDREIDYLGFTFSFPCNQLALNSGLLIRWTKGFSASGVEGQDVVLLLRKACEKRNLKINDYVLINDTTGTLLCGAFEDKHAKIGVINGTGTNACYLEEITKVQKWLGPMHHRRVIINTEWGSFGENGELRDLTTSIDSLVDTQSINPGRQIFEKAISGMYLGKVVRLLICKASEQKLIFNGDMPAQLKQEDTFPSSYISYSYVKEKFIPMFFEKFGYQLSEEQYEQIKKVCDVVSRRSAAFCAAGLAAILNRIDCPKGVIAADGSMFRRHPYFVPYVQDVLRKLVRPRDFRIILVDDGSGKGAALAACVASSLLNTNNVQSETLSSQSSSDFPSYQSS